MDQQTKDYIHAMFIKDALDFAISMGVLFLIIVIYVIFNWKEVRELWPTPTNKKKLP